MGDDCQTPFTRAGGTVATSDALWMRAAGSARGSGLWAVGRVMETFCVTPWPWRGDTVEVTKKKVILTRYPVDGAHRSSSWGAQGMGRTLLPGCADFGLCWKEGGGRCGSHPRWLPRPNLLQRVSETPMGVAGMRVTTERRGDCLRGSGQPLARLRHPPLPLRRGSEEHKPRQSRSQPGGAAVLSPRPPRPTQRYFLLHTFFGGIQSWLLWVSRFYR